MLRRETVHCLPIHSSSRKKIGITDNQIQKKEERERRMNKDQRLDIIDRKLSEIQTLSKQLGDMLRYPNHDNDKKIDHLQEIRTLAIASLKHANHMLDFNIIDPLEKIKHHIITAQRNIGTVQFEQTLDNLLPTIYSFTKTTKASIILHLSGDHEP